MCGESTSVLGERVTHFWSGLHHSYKGSSSSFLWPITSLCWSLSPYFTWLRATTLCAHAPLSQDRSPPPSPEDPFCTCVAWRDEGSPLLQEEKYVVTLYFT